MAAGIVSILDWVLGRIVATWYPRSPKQMKGWANSSPSHHAPVKFLVVSWVWREGDEGGWLIQSKHRRLHLTAIFGTTPLGRRDTQNYTKWGLRVTKVDRIRRLTWFRPHFVTLQRRLLCCWATSRKRCKRFFLIRRPPKIHVDYQLWAYSQCAESGNYKPGCRQKHCTLTIFHKLGNENEPRRCLATMSQSAEYTEALRRIPLQ